MTQENLPAGDDRSRPRFQAPTVGGFSTNGNQTPGGFSVNGSQNTGSYPSPNIPPAQPVSPPDPYAARPVDWPAPDTAFQSGSFPPPVSGPIGIPGAPPYQPPFVSPVAPWEAGAQAGPRTDNFYRYERYSQQPYNPQPPDPQAEAYRKAASRVRAKIEFQKHLRVYIFVNVILWAIALLTLNPAHPGFWPIWITVFWGIGLFAQYWQISGREDDQRRRMIDEEMRRRNWYK